MVLEHEIPQGSKLYFSKSAKLKRKIETLASTILEQEGFEEIVTPLFSYHQHQSIEDSRELIRLSDMKNNQMTLRADSTIDVVRIIEKRLGRNIDHKKWFYIQPVVRYPATELYQIGAEVIGQHELEPLLKVVCHIFETLECQPLLQLSNINIPNILVSEFGFDIEDFKRIEVQKLKNSAYAWMDDLVHMNRADEIDEALLKKVPQSIAQELEKLKNLAKSLDYPKMVVAPLYYAKMRYYDELFFRFIEHNSVLSRGGKYRDNGVDSVGFALYTDELIELIDTKLRG